MYAYVYIHIDMDMYVHYSLVCVVYSNNTQRTKHVSRGQVRAGLRAVYVCVHVQVYVHMYVFVFVCVPCWHKTVDADSHCSCVQL